MKIPWKEADCLSCRCDCRNRAETRCCAIAMRALVYPDTHGRRAATGEWTLPAAAGNATRGAGKDRFADSRDRTSGRGVWQTNRENAIERKCEIALVSIRSLFRGFALSRFRDSPCVWRCRAGSLSSALPLF